MKEATGEVSMTVITIVLVAVILTIATAFFNGPGKDWISKTFNRLTGEQTANTNFESAQ